MITGSLNVVQPVLTVPDRFVEEELKGDTEERTEGWGKLLMASLIFLSNCYIKILDQELVRPMFRRVEH